MKKILLSLVFVSTIVMVKAQSVVLNEIYGNPGGSNSEFIELYNSAGAGSMDCYTIMTYYQNEGGSAQGWYVLDLPNTPPINSAPGFYVLASQTPFSVQGTSGANADVNWNALSFRDGTTHGYLEKFEFNGSGYNDLNLPFATNITNLLDGTLNGGQIYITLLFKNGVLINGFAGGAATGDLQDLLGSLGTLNFSLDCGGMITNSSINFTTIPVVEFFNPSGGNDNGYARSSDGKCGAWVKTAPQVNHSPGVTNGSASNLAGSLEVANVIRCGEFGGDTAPRVEFNITGFTGDVNFTDDFPIEVYLFYDNGDVPGVLDGNDEAHITSFKEINDTAVATVDTFHFKEGYGVVDIILLYRTQRGCFDRVVALTNPCSALPVSLMSFNATRNRSTVALTWQTVMEENNRGFDVQRKIGTNGTWTSVGFVQSKSVNGNSNTPLSYEFLDVNSTRGITQYRLRQLDYDGKSNYSLIRAVRGEEQKGKTIIYPNPSSDGKVNIIFDDVNAIRDISVTDISGRMIRQMKAVTNNNIQIENLNAGFYTVRILNTETGEQVVEKFVVNKR